MQAGLMDRRAAVRAREDEPETLASEAAEVAALLMRAGVDHASSLWFQLLELATQEACDWTERSEEFGPKLRPRAAALLGLRSLAASLISSTTELDDATRAAAEACLAICADSEAKAALAPPRRRRWGEGATPQSPQRPGLLQRTVGCC